MQALVPIVIKPRFLSIRNSWRRRHERRQHWIRNLILVLMTLALMYGAYAGGVWVLEQTETQLDFAYLHPTVILGLILVCLFFMLVITNSASAAGALFLGQDLELLYSSPLPPFRFFGGKFAEVIFSSSWMTAVFLIPVVLFFGTHYHAPPSYYLLSLVALVPFFVLPGACAILIATLLALIMPANRKRELLIIVGALCLFGLYSLARMVALGIEDGSPVDTIDIFRIVALLSIANKIWSPPYWAAAVMGESLVTSEGAMRWHMMLLYGSSAFLVALDFLLLRFCYFQAYSRAALHAQATRIKSRRSNQLWSRLTSGLPAPVRGLAVKEAKSVSRDVTQAVQMLLILGLCALYLYMLSFQGLFQRIIPIAQKDWWRVFLISCNLCMEAFVITAIANRLVFPSVSREGRSFWTLQTAPITMRRLLMTKYWAWLVLVGVFTSVVFVGAASLLAKSILVVVFKLFLNLATAIGVVGLAVGLGAYFKNFEWEHPAQLTMGFGNMVYMLAGVGLIAVNLFLGGGLLVTAYASGVAKILAAPKLFLMVGAGLVVIYLLNITVAYFALRLGVRALESEA